MNTTQISILMYGHDARLLETSQWALQSRGYRVLTATHHDQFDSIPQQPPIDLLVVSHALGAKERAETEAQAAARWPGVKRLVLARDNSSTPGRVPGVSGQARPALDVLGGLLSRVGELVGYAGSSSYSHIY